MEIDENLLSKVSDFLNTEQGAQIVSDLKSSLGEKSGGILQEKSKESVQNSINMTKLVPLVSAISSAKTDSRAADLLIALKPLLNEKRRPKIDRAISVMRIISLIPILEEYGFSISDIFN